MEYKHVPVMLEEVVECLRPRSGDNFVDCTLGGGGYSFAIAGRILPGGRLVAIDLDKMAIANAAGKIEKNNKFSNILLVNDNFRNLQKIISGCFQEEEAANIAGIVFDLGLSSAQLEDRDRGFSFQLDAPLDMAFAGGAGRGTEDIVNHWPEIELEMIFREYGEERFAKRIANRIVRARQEKKIATTRELVGIIKSAIPPKFRLTHKTHFATRAFQALRIATNDELGNLEAVLPQAVELLRPGGRVAVVSYHSLEDRIVKNFFKNESRGCICPDNFPICNCGHQAKIKIITKKALTPSETELSVNPRARSAKLRVAEKLPA